MSSPIERQIMPPMVGSDSALLACLPFPALIFDVKSLAVVESNAYFCNENNISLSKLFIKYDYHFFTTDDFSEIVSKLKTEKPFSVHKFADNLNKIRTFEITFNLLPDRNFAFLLLNQLSAHLMDDGFQVPKQNMSEPDFENQAQLLKRLVDSAFEGIGLIDKDYKIVFCNTSFARLFSMKADSMIGQYLPELLDGNGSEAIAEFEINKFGLDTTFELTIPSLQKGDQYFLFKAFPNFDERKHYTGSFVTILNISSQRHTEDELAIARGKAHNADRLISSFLTNMSHEIRTPMNSILGFSSMLKRSGLSKVKRDQYLDIVCSKGKQLMSIITDIIDITKIEENQIQLSKGPCDINQLMEDIFETYSVEVAKNGKPLKLILNSSHQTNYDCIMVDSIRLVQVLSNLLNNSLKFTESGYIEFGFKFEESKTILFYVKDTGIGVLPELKELVFERFRQADESFTRNYGGTGLGLSISKGLVNLMGGKIWVESDGANGSVFNFTLPFDSDEDCTIKEMEDTIQIRNLHDKTILIIEDDQASFQLLNEYLEMMDCKVIHAYNGKEALNCLQESVCIDLILLDIQLPIMDGYQVARTIRKINPTIPIIAQTAHAMVSDRKKCIEAGCDDYLSKPIQMDLLEKILGEYLS